MVWIGFTAWIAYGAQWFANTVYEGDSDAPDGSIRKQHFADGMRAFSIAGQVKSVVSLCATLLIIFTMMYSSIRPRYVYAPCIFLGAAASFMAAIAVGHNGNFAVICTTMAEITGVGSFSVPFGIIAMLNERMAREGKTVSTALQMSLLNCCVTVGMQVCTMFLAGVEGFVELDKALPIGFMFAASALSVAGVATLFLNDAPGEAVATTSSDEENTTTEDESGGATTSDECGCVAAC